LDSKEKLKLEDISQPAFPTINPLMSVNDKDNVTVLNGITKLEFFVATAMHGLLSNSEFMQKTISKTNGVEELYLVLSTMPVAVSTDVLKSIEQFKREEVDEN